MAEGRRRATAAQERAARLDARVLELESQVMTLEEERARLEAAATESARAHAVALAELGATLANAEDALKTAEDAHRSERQKLAAKLEAAERALGEERERRGRVDRDAVGLAADAAARLDELTRRVEQAEQELEAERERRRQAESAAAAAMSERAQYSRRVEELKGALRIAEERAATAEGGGRRDGAGRYDLNAVTVEGLRQLGLSVTQAARLVSYREARRGFASVAELADIPGFPEAHRRELEARVYVE